MCAGEMFAIVGAAFVVGMIAVCIGPFLNCKEWSSDKHVSGTSETIECDSPVVRIKISRPYQDESTGEIVFDPSEANESKDTKHVELNEGPIAPEEPRIIRAESPCNRRRVPSGIWSSELRNQLENITNSSSEVCGSVRVVRARVETQNPPHSGSSVAFKSLQCDDGGSRDEKDRKLSSAVVKKWRNLKKTLICTRTEQSMLFKDSEPNGTRRPDTSTRTTNPRASPECTATLRKNRFVDVSTSTRISAGASRSRPRNDEILAKSCNPPNNHEAARTILENDRRSIVDPNVDGPREMVSLTKRQSINGKSICDVRISGLAMNQAQLLDLFEATEGKARSASIVTTEEASIISIKFHRGRGDHDASRPENASHHGECPLRKLYRTLPEIFDDLSIGKLFRSNEVSGKSDRLADSVRVTDQSRTTSGSRNETSYIALPKATGKLVTEESRFDRTGTLSRRFGNDHASRFFEERRI